MYLTKKYLKWIRPLLYEPEHDILINHTQLSNSRIRIKDRKKVLKKYNLTYRQLYWILWKLEFYTRLYELETIAFDE